MLKYEDLFKIGDTIRAYDFEPIDDRPEMYVEGVIVGIHDEEFKGYILDVKVDTVFIERPRLEVVAPMEISFMEFVGRLRKVTPAVNLPGFEKNPLDDFPSIRGL